MVDHVDAAIERIKNHPFCTSMAPSAKGLYVGHSGGKDSVVIAELARRAGVTTIIHNPKASVHPMTHTFLVTRPYEIEYVESEHHVDLCTSRKLTTQIDGTRIAEHDRADGRSTDVVMGGLNVSRTELTPYVKNGLNGLNYIFPIYDWSDEQVWRFIKDEGLPYSPEYDLPSLIVAPHPDDELIGCYSVLRDRQVKRRDVPSAPLQELHIAYTYATTSRMLEAYSLAARLCLTLVSVEGAAIMARIGQYLEVYVPSRRDAHCEHRATNQQFFKYATAFYSVDMVDAKPLPETEAQEKKLMLNRHYPSQRALWDRDHKYFLFESIHRTDYRETCEVSLGLLTVEALTDYRVALAAVTPGPNMIDDILSIVKTGPVVISDGLTKRTYG